MSFVAAVKREARDISVRAAKTAVQTFVGLVTVDAIMAGQVDTFKKAATAATAAGVSVVWNAVRAKAASWS